MINNTALMAILLLNKQTSSPSMNQVIVWIVSVLITFFIFANVLNFILIIIQIPFHFIWKRFFNNKNKRKDE